jgi:hypothetical protein
MTTEDADFRPAKQPNYLGWGTSNRHINAANTCSMYSLITFQMQKLPTRL